MAVVAGTSGRRQIGRDRYAPRIRHILDGQNATEAVVFAEETA
jgi:hypothetical protein